MPNISLNTATLFNKSPKEKTHRPVNKLKRRHRKKKKYHEAEVKQVAQVTNKRDGDPCQYCFKILKARTHTKHLIMRHRQLIISNHPEIYEQFHVQCEECDEKFLRKASDLAQHMKEVHGKENRIPCPYRERRSKHNAQLNYHIFFVHKEKRTLHPQIEPKEHCDDCGDQFFTTHQLENHKKQNHTGKISCPLCSKLYNNEKRLENHYTETHKTEGKCICHLCQKAFNNKSSLRIHVRDVHLGGKQYSFECTLCTSRSGKYQSQEKLQQHILDRHSGVEYKCAECSSVFHTEDSRRHHKNRIHGEQNVKCDQCNKMFHSKGLMKIHVSNVHLKEKKKMCPTCGEAFIDHNTFKAHMNRHNNIRPYLCQDCDKDFLTNDALKWHMKRHINNRPHKCEQCSLTFLVRSDLNQHTDRVHLGILQECRHGCEFKTLRLSNRPRHEKYCSLNPIPGAPWTISNGTASRYVLETYNASK